MTELATTKASSMKPFSGEKMNHYTTTTTAPAEKLWCIHIPGPDDLFAAPDQQTAQKMADLHNAAMREYVEKNKLSWGGEMITAEVIEWPYDADETHAEALLEFDPEEWGLGQPSPKVMHLPSELKRVKP